jgi:glycosyltransferase involved in cell wall biosynthesis
MRAAVGFVLKGYPRLSETFIAQEIRALERRGVDIRLFSMRRPGEAQIHPVHREIAAPVTYLPEYLHREPLRVLRGWKTARRLPGFRRAVRAWVRDLGRDRTANRVRRFGQAVVLAAEMPEEIGWLHSHFLHTPASVTRYVALMRTLPWSASAHAKDVWTIPAWEKREKLAGCRWLVTCTSANAEHLRKLAPSREHVELVYHGLDFARFPLPDRTRPTRDGSDPSDPVIILSVGRAVEKKGYDVLIEALLRVPEDHNWRFVHIGDGVLLRALKRQAEAAGLAGRIRWMGSQPHAQVLAALRRSDLFVLASRIARDGDRDGLPNVLMEAQSQGLACLATRVSAIPELIVDGESGLLVPPADAGALACALALLIRSPTLRDRLGRAGLRRVRTAFSMEDGVDRLAARFGPAIERPLCASPFTRR